MCSVQSLSHARLFVTPQTTARQVSLSITNSRSLLKLMSIESVMPCNHLTLCHPLLLPPSIFSSIRVFSSELFLSIRWPKYWSFSLSISPSNEDSGLISFRIDWLDLLAVIIRLKHIGINQNRNHYNQPLLAYLRNKFVYSCSIKIHASGFSKLLESIFCILLVVKAFSLQKVVEMPEELVVGWWERSGERGGWGKTS